MPGIFPNEESCYADPSGAAAASGPGPACAHCLEPKALHLWTCGACGSVVANGEEQPMLHGMRHPLHRNLRHSPNVHLVCPPGSTFKGARPKPKGTGPNYGPLPTPQLMAGPVTVDEAWALFGIPKKRGQKADVKKRYLQFVFEHHPDKVKGKKKKAEADAQLARANQAWDLLVRHCRW